MQNQPLTPPVWAAFFRRAGLCASLLFMLSLPACQTFNLHSHPAKIKKTGPPAHAPAHGYRRKHQGADLKFDTGLGVYLVLGKTGVYFSDNKFLKKVSSGWAVSVSPNGPWKVKSGVHIPAGLVKKHKGKHGKHHDKHHGKHHGKGKH